MLLTLIKALCIEMTPYPINMQNMPIKNKHISRRESE